MDRLQAMETFVRVAEAGSFSAVAERLNLARSVVTRQVAALEKHLGVRLIARSTRRLNLTAEGAAYLEKCRDILGLVAAAEGDLAGDRQAPRGPVRLTVPVNFGVRRLMPLLGEFAQRYPQVDLDVECSDRRVNLIEEGMDLAIRIGDRIEETAVARRLGTSSLVTVAAPAYLAHYGVPWHPSELAHHAGLHYTLAAAQGWPYRVDGRLAMFPVGIRLRANNGDALLLAAEQGLGIVQQPGFIAADALHEGRLQRLLVAYPSPQLLIFAVFPGNRHVPHRVRVLVDYLAERIGDTPDWEQHVLQGVVAVQQTVTSGQRDAAVK
jgi:DNA-binding transcriptional LysR family regulator